MMPRVYTSYMSIFFATTSPYFVMSCDLANFLLATEGESKPILKCLIVACHNIFLLLLTILTLAIFFYAASVKIMGIGMLSPRQASFPVHSIVTVTSVVESAFFKKATLLKQNTFPVNEHRWFE